MKEKNKMTDSNAQKAHLSLASAVLINVNIMLGSGIFINNVNLAQAAGPLSTLSYPLVGFLLIPLIAIFSLLLNYYPGATFYELGEKVHPVFGFISSWGYFIGKLASSALSIHVSVATTQLLVPAIASINPLLIDVAILGIFILLNLFNVKTERPIQYLFVSLKSIPVFIVVGAAITLFNPVNLVVVEQSVMSLFSTIPFVIFGFAGFEASCSLSKNIKNPARNGPRAIIISFAIVLIAVTLFQLGLFAALGGQYMHFTTFQEPIRMIIANCFSGSLLVQNTLITAAFVGIASSALGASYSILYSNVWNLHTLAGYNVIPGAKRLRHCNRFSAPSLSILIAGLITFGYLIGSRGNNIPLQQISACATTLAYSVSVLSFLYLSFGTLHKYRTIGILGVFSCLLFLLTTLMNAHKFGVLPYGILALGILIGLLMRAATRRAQNGQSTRA